VTGLFTHFDVEIAESDVLDVSGSSSGDRLGIVGSTEDLDPGSLLSVEHGDADRRMARRELALRQKNTEDG